MTLDARGGMPADGTASDYIRIECSLGKKFVAAVFVSSIMSIFGEQFFRRVLKYFNKLVADNFPFLLGIGHAAQFRKETLAGIDILQAHMKIFPKNTLHHFFLARPQQSVIHKNAGELIADRLVQQRRRDG